MDFTRRQFIKSAAAQSAVATAAVLFPGISFGAWKNVGSGGIEWKKTPCRFCGTGCGLLVGVSGDRAVAVKGDPNSRSTRGSAASKAIIRSRSFMAKTESPRRWFVKTANLWKRPLRKPSTWWPAKCRKPSRAMEKTP